MPIRYVKNRGFGEIDDNYTEGTLVNNTALTITITVPNDEVWIYYGGYVRNGDDVMRAVQVELLNQSNIRIMWLFPATNLDALDSVNVSGNLSSNFIPQLPLLLKPGWKIKFFFASGGASSGGTATVCVFVEKFKV